MNDLSLYRRQENGFNSTNYLRATSDPAPTPDPTDLLDPAYALADDTVPADDTDLVQKMDKETRILLLASINQFLPPSIYQSISTPEKQENQ